MNIADARNSCEILKAIKQSSQITNEQKILLQSVIDSLEKFINKGDKSFDVVEFTKVLVQFAKYFISDDPVD